MINTNSVSAVLQVYPYSDLVIVRTVLRAITVQKRTCRDNFTSTRNLESSTMNGSMLEGLGEFTLHKIAPEPKISYQLH